MPRLGTNQLGNEPAIQEAMGVPTVTSGMVDRDDFMWRRLGGGNKMASPTSIPPYKQLQGIFVSRYLYMFNPLARRMSEIMRDFVVGGTGFQVKADDTDVQKFIDSVWDHRHNRFWKWMPDYTLALSVDGELCLPVQVTPGNPIPIFGYISPLDIRNIEPLAFRRGSPKNILVGPEDVGTPDIVYPALGAHSLDEIEAMAPDQAGIIGAFFYAINGLPDHPRGIPDLFALSDDLDQFNKTNWARMRKTEQEGTYVWDITLQGASASIIEDFERSLLLNPPLPGGYRVHNDRVKWDTVQPEGGGKDSSAEMRYHRSNLSSQFGVPDFFMTGESGAGRIASAELWNTVIATAGSRQRILRVLISEVMEFAIDWGILQGALKPDVNRKFRITAPIVGIRDLQRMSGMILNLLEGVLTMHSSHILGDDSVRGIMRALLANLGFEIDDEEQLGKIIDANMVLAKAKASSIAVGGGGVPTAPAAVKTVPAKTPAKKNANVGAPGSSGSISKAGAAK